MSDAPFTDHLRRIADPVWQAQFDHPMVRGIGDGSLPPEIFGYWLRQDYLFLIDYSRLFALAVVRAPDLEAMTMFSQLLHETLTREMDLHRTFVGDFGTQGYTDFLLRTAATGEYADLLGALLPCMWGYSEIGQHLAKLPPPADTRYQAWIETYADPEFARLAQWCRELTDEACAGLPESRLRAVEQAFLTSSRYELAFWEMAWSGERWLA
jgi:thiaminase/transcriptional activator TenA